MMKLVYTNENQASVHNAKNIIENSGIPFILKNEHTSTGMHPQFMFMELWITDDSDYDRATKLLSPITSTKETEDWVCPSCKETNDASFEICWNCSSYS